MSINENLPPAPEGALIYTHPQGKTIYVSPDGSMVVYKADGKRGTSSATVAKLAAGHGGWELVSGSAPAPDPTARLAVSDFDLVPQLAQEAEIDMMQTLALDSRRVFEQKLDGQRVLVRCRDGKVIFLNRNGQPYGNAVPRALGAWTPPDGEWVFDGELVGNTYWVFDVPVTPVSGELDSGPLWARRAGLEALYEAGLLGPMRLVPQAREVDEKVLLAKRVIEEGMEGIVAKRSDSQYHAGSRTSDWLKLKITKTVDVVVTAVRDDGKDSVSLGLYNDDNGIVDIGRASLIGKEKRGLIDVDDVLEVKYLYVGAQGRLYQPRILRKRSDKRPEQCTTDQLQHVNKKVLEAIA